MTGVPGYLPHKIYLYKIRLNYPPSDTPNLCLSIPLFLLPSPSSLLPSIPSIHPSILLPLSFFSNHSPSFFFIPALLFLPAFLIASSFLKQLGPCYQSRQYWSCAKFPAALRAGEAVCEILSLWYSLFKFCGNGFALKSTDSSSSLTSYFL